ncbi:cytochrome P450 [Xylariales sp. PMI_506]|nr:cytochrome P450 [Xylariales sp. PMI_506]
MALPGLTGIDGALVAVALVIVYYVLSSLAAWVPYRHIPGPLGAKFSYFWLVKSSISGRSWERYTKLNRDYGSLVQMAPGTLLTDDPDILRRMSSARSEYKRSNWYRAMKLDPTGDSMFSLRDTKAHDKLKAKCASGYGGRETPTLENDVDAEIAAWIDLIRTKYAAKVGEWKPLDFAQSSQFFTLDSITRISYGKAFGFLKEVDVYDYIRATVEAVPFLKVCAEVPFLQNIMFSDLGLRLMGPKTTDAKGLGRLMGVAEEVVKERFSPDAKAKQDMLGSFIRRGLTQYECAMEIPFQIFAGSDTTATAIRVTMLYIITTPRVYAALTREIEDGVSRGVISSPVTNEEAKKLPYLQAVIYEGLRMNAPFTGLLAKEVPAGGDTLNGLFVPAGTRIAHSTWSLLRNQSVFGEDSELFRPERFLISDAHRATEMRNTVELAFGHGRWKCSGQAIALLELNKVFVELLRYFDFQLANPTQPWTSRNFNIFMQNDMWVKVTERDSE